MSVFFWFWLFYLVWEYFYFYTKDFFFFCFVSFALCWVYKFVRLPTVAYLRIDSERTALPRNNVFLYMMGILQKLRLKWSLRIHHLGMAPAYSHLSVFCSYIVNLVLLLFWEVFPEVKGFGWKIVSFIGFHQH